jgi:shikimate kinase
MKNIILFGQKNAGKTFFGKFLSKFLNFNFIDTDHLLENFYFLNTSKKLSTKKIFLYHGESFFRNFEKKTILSIDKNTKNTIISIGAGAILDKDTKNFLKDLGNFIFLKISLKTFLKRSHQNSLPTLLTLKSLEEHFKKREKILKKIKSKVLDTQNFFNKNYVKYNR